MAECNRKKDNRKSAVVEEEKQPPDHKTVFDEASNRKQHTQVQFWPKKKKKTVQTNWILMAGSLHGAHRVI